MAVLLTAKYMPSQIYISTFTRAHLDKYVLAQEALGTQKNNPARGSKNLVLPKAV